MQSWTIADPNFIVHDPSVVHLDAASGAMFNPIPGAVPGGGNPTHMLNGVTGQAVWLGTYNATTERFTITTDALRWLDIGGGGSGFSGGAAHWAATSDAFNPRPEPADRRLLWVAWVTSGGKDAPSVLSLIRELTWDRKVRTVVSYPVAEYIELRNATFISGAAPSSGGSGTSTIEGAALSKFQLEPGTIKQLEAIPSAAGGALDLEVSFDLSTIPADATVARFGVAVRAPLESSTDSNSSVLAEAAQNVWFEVGPKDPESGSRRVTVAGIMNGLGPPNPPRPFKCYRGACPSNTTTLFVGETLDVRILVDRPVTEVYVLGGRIAFVHGDGTFTLDKTAVYVYNQDISATVQVANVTAYGMDCGWRSDLPAPRARSPAASP